MMVDEQWAGGLLSFSAACAILPHLQCVAYVLLFLWEKKGDKKNLVALLQEEQVS